MTMMSDRFGPDQDFDSGRAWIQSADGAWFEVDIPEQYDIAPQEFALWMQNAEKAGVLDPDDPDDWERWESLSVEIPHAEAASRMGYVLRSLRSDHKRKIAPIESEVNRLNDKLRTMQRRFDTQEAYLVQQLTQWHRMQLDLDPGRKTIELPSVTLKSTKARAKAMLVEEVAVQFGTDSDSETACEVICPGQEAFEQFVTSHYDTDNYPEWVRYKETWDLGKREILKLVKEGRIVEIDGRFRECDPETGELGPVLEWLRVEQPTDLDRTFQAVTE